MNVLACHIGLGAEHEVEEPARVAAGEKRRDGGDEDEERDEPAAAPAPVSGLRGDPPAAPDEDPDDQVVRDREQPLDQPDERLRSVRPQEGESSR